MRTGKLRHRVTLQAKVPATGPSGQPMPGPWADVATYWAEVETRPGAEASDGRQVRAVGQVEVTLRERPGLRAAVGPTRRFSFEGRVLEIVGAADGDVAGRKLVVVCKEEARPS